MITITSDNFNRKVLSSRRPVLLDFWARWCAPCKSTLNVLKIIEKEYTGILAVGRVNVDKEPDITARYQIASIPTILIIKNGKVQSELIGSQPRQIIEDMVKKHI